MRSQAIMMFYGDDCVPRAYVEKGLTVPHRPWAHGLFPGEIQKIGNYILCLYEKP